MNTGRVLKKLVAASLFFCFCGCTIKNLEHNSIDNAINVNKTSDIVAYVFAHNKNMEGGSDTLAAFQYVLSAAIPLFPFPPDFRYAIAPEIWSDFNETIDDEIDIKFTTALNSSIGSEYIQINPKPAINDLIKNAKAAGKKYVYIVRYNNYKKIEFSTAAYANRYTSYTYDGSINMMSRVLIDVENNKLVLDRQRLAEKFKWNIFFVLFWHQDVTSTNEVKSYIDDVGSTSEDGAVLRSVLHLIRCDFKRACHY